VSSTGDLHQPHLGSSRLPSDHGHYFESKKGSFVFPDEKPEGETVAVTNHDDPKGDAVVEGVDLPIFRYDWTFL